MQTRRQIRHSPAAAGTVRGRKLELHQERRCRTVKVAVFEAVAAGDTAGAWVAAVPIAVARTSATRTAVVAAAEHLRKTAVDHPAAQILPNSPAENFHRRHEEHVDQPCSETARRAAVPRW